MTRKVTTRQEASSLRDSLEEDGDHEPVSSWVRRFLQEVVTGERAPVAKLHPLGFHCLPVYRAADFGLCVHGWLPGAQRETSPTSDMHMHTFDMISRVLCGCVTNKELGLVERGPDRYRIFEIDKDGGEDVDVFTDTGIDTAVEERGTVKVAVGEQYDIARTVYHSAEETVRKEEFTVTLMLATNWDDSPQRTLIEVARAGHVPLRYERRLLPEAAIRSAAREILELL
jgi:hypothetical protein